MRLRGTAARGQRTGFTLIELLVVVAIIALLISILVPSLNAARRQARALTCATNMRHVGTAVATYLAVNNGIYPPSYVYPTDADGNWSLRQDTTKQYGYSHWSWFLYDRGNVDLKSFQCPEIQFGGHPRTNPGRDTSNWNANEAQVDDTHGGPPGTREDKQAPRMAFRANAAIMPRNKFLPADFPGQQRYNQFVRENAFGDKAGRIVLVTESHEYFPAICVQDGSSNLSKSHRSINPFFHITTGSDEYSAPQTSGDGFLYGDGTADKNLGLRPWSEIERKPGLVEDPSVSEVNTIGRHHPGGDKLGGTTNFLYIDGSVERKPVLDTLRGREWGNKYYSLTGNNRVRWGN